MNYFPELSEKELNLSDANLAIRTFGKRIYNGQTVNEYLTEFLLVFIGEKGEKKGFRKIDQYYKKNTTKEVEEYIFNKKFEYIVFPYIGLRRFIFLENSKSSNRYKIDEELNQELNEIMFESINTNVEEMTEMLRAFLYGFVSISKNRGWFAKTMLPMSSECIFPEAMGLKEERSNIEKFKDEDKDINRILADQEFGWKRYNFQARGGEVYYLHLVNGFRQLLNKDSSKANELINDIDNKINNLLNSFPQISRLTKFISDKWLDNLRKHSEFETIEEVKKELSIKKEAAWIITRNNEVSINSVKELSHLLDNYTSEFEMIDLLATCITLQIIRKMHSDINEQIDDEIAFVFHIDSNEKHDKKIKKICQSKFKKNEELFQIVLDKNLRLMNTYKKNKNKDDSELLKEGYLQSHKLIRKLGKELDIIYPKTGRGMRYVFSENLIKLLVLLFVEPGRSITLDSFYERIYSSFKIIIREKEYYEHYKENANILNYNSHEFQLLLKENGFLKELSDAVSIVENPYSKMEVK